MLEVREQYPLGSDRACGAFRLPKSYFQKVNGC